MKPECRLLFSCLLAVLLSACGSRSSPTSTPAEESMPPRTTTEVPTTLPPKEPAPAYTPTPEPEIDSPTWFDDAILYEVVLTKGISQKTRVELHMTAKGRATFGEKRALTLLPSS